MKSKNNIQLLEKAIHASIKAGFKVYDIYQMDFDIDYKDDQSPLTIADTASHKIIEEYLKPLKIPMLSEEGKSIPLEERNSWDLMWIIDPLDGTKEFIKRNGEFTINIALISQGDPILGVIYIPVEQCLYFASKQTGSIKVKDITMDDLNISIDDLIKRGVKLPCILNKTVYTIVGSKSHFTKETELYIQKIKEKHGEVNILSKGSSLKICMVAEGNADIYPRFAPTMEWDIAAGHAIVKYAGAKIINAKTLKEITYNTESLINPWFIVCR
jgi:3'(2'), 5'-bisphosphate nucleotidase